MPCALRLQVAQALAWPLRAMPCGTMPTCGRSRLPTPPAACPDKRYLEFVMKPLDRVPVSKVQSVRKFNAKARTVAAANMRIGPMRGGWRL